MGLHDLLSEAAMIAAANLKRHYGNAKVHESKYGGTGAVDIVTEADIDTERLLRRFFAARMGGYPVIGEEFGADSIHSDRAIFIDPLDGTLLFHKRRGNFGPIIAVYEDGRYLGGAECGVMEDILHVGTETGGIVRQGDDTYAPRTVYCGGQVFHENRELFLRHIAGRLPGIEITSSPSILNKSRVFSGHLAGFFHPALARHDLGAAPLFGRLTGIPVTDAWGNALEPVDLHGVARQYRTGRKEEIYSESILIAQPAIHGPLLEAVQDAYCEIGITSSAATR